MARPSNPRPINTARACGADRLCTEVPVDEVWVEKLGTPTGGYWVPVCRTHLEQANNREGDEE